VGATGARGIGLAFDIVRTSTDTTIAMPSNQHSVVYLVTTRRRDSVTITLPPAADAVSRMVTVTCTDCGRRVIVRSQGHEPIDGARNPIVLDGRYDSFTLVSDGHEWVVLFRRD
jgi:hypothetical protein